MNFDHYLFDLDGTLTDPGDGIKNSIKYALKKHRLNELPDETLNAFIGPPLLDSFQKYCNASAAEANLLLQYYREYFSTKGMYENKVYPGTYEMLSALKETGKKLYVATSKPEKFAIQILDHFKMAEFFSFIGGSTMNETRTSKDEVIGYVMKTNNLESKNCLMIGDRIYDIEGARKHDMKVAAVLYGYGDAEELRSADFLINEPMGLLGI